MPKVLQFSASAADPIDPKTEKITDAIRTLLSALSAAEQQRVLRELAAKLPPSPTPRAGQVLGTVVRIVPGQKEWTVGEIKEKVTKEGIEASTKEIYNAVGYLARRGKLRRVGYGKYLVDGALLETIEDLGLEPGRYED